MTQEEHTLSPPPTDSTLSLLHPLLQKEDARRSNRRRRCKEGAYTNDTTLDSSVYLDTSISRTELSSDSLALKEVSDPSLALMSKKLSQMQASLDTLQCSEQFLREENSNLIERLAIAKSSSQTMDDSVRDMSCTSRDVSLGEELRASLLEVERGRVEGKKMKDELRLARKRAGYLESELETYKLRLSLSETRGKEAECEVAEFQKKLDQNESEILALRSRESEVSRLLSEAETDRRSLERIREVQSTLTENSYSIDKLRDCMLSAEKRANELELERRSLLERVETAEREKRELEGVERVSSLEVKQLKDEIVRLEAELIRAKAESLTNEKRLAGIEKAKEAELNYLKDQVNTKDQLIACKSMEVEGAKKEANSCKQEVKGMAVSLEIKEFELEQLREYKLLIKNQEARSDKAQAEDSKQLTQMKETLSDIQNKHQELVNQTETEKTENGNKQESLLSQIAELKKSRKSLIKQLKKLEQLYTAKESTHSSVEGEFSKLSKLFYALKEKNLLPDSSEMHSVMESIYQPSVSKINELSSIRMDPDTVDFTRSGLKRSQSEGAELKSILKKPHDFSPRSSTPNTSHEYNANLAYTATKHDQWLTRKETSDIL